MPHTETPLFGVDFFAHLFERVFCPHPSLTALFLKCLMSAINSVNNISNTHSWFTNLIPDITPSHAHSSASNVTLIAFSIVLRHVIQIRGASRLQSYTLCNPRLAPSASPRFCYLFTAHSPHPYLQISFHRSISPVQHRALYKKSLCCYVQVAPWDPYTRLSAFLILFVCSRPLACVAVHTLACSSHHHSFAAFFHSFSSVTSCIFLRIVLSGLSLVVCLRLIGPRQRDICSAVLVLRNLQITEYFVPRLELNVLDVLCSTQHYCMTGPPNNLFKASFLLLIPLWVWFTVDVVQVSSWNSQINKHRVQTTHVWARK